MKQLNKELDLVASANNELSQLHNGDFAKNQRENYCILKMVKMVLISKTSLRSYTNMWI